MGPYVEGLSSEQFRYDRMDHMVENLLQSLEEEKGVEKKLEEERYKSYQYCTPPKREESYLAKESMQRPFLEPLESNHDVNEDSKSMMRAVFQVASLDIEEMGFEGETYLLRRKEAEYSYERQRNNTINLLIAGETCLEDMEERGEEKSSNVRIEESFQVMSAIMKTEAEDLISLEGSMMRLARALSFLSGVIERLDLLFRLYAEDSPLKRWLRECGFPESVERPIRAVISGMLLGENASGFAGNEFKGVVGGEDLSVLFSPLGEINRDSVSFDAFSETVEGFINDVIEYLSDELKESEETAKVLKFILSLMILMLLLLMETLFSLDDGEGGPKKIKGKEEMSDLLRKDIVSNENVKAVQVAFQLVEKIFNCLSEAQEEKKEEIKEEEGKREELLDEAMIEALNSMLRKMLSNEDETREKFHEMFKGVSDSVNNIFEQEKQTITLRISNIA